MSRRLAVSSRAQRRRRAEPGARVLVWRARERWSECGADALTLAKGERVDACWPGLKTGLLICW